jgi:hypothetical protein
MSIEAHLPALCDPEKKLSRAQLKYWRHVVHPGTIPAEDAAAETSLDNEVVYIEAALAQYDTENTEKLAEKLGVGIDQAHMVVTSLREKISTNMFTYPNESDISCLFVDNLGNISEAEGRPKAIINNYQAAAEFWNTLPSPNLN